MSVTYDGSCNCGKVRYQLQGRPLIVNCCHCTFCQRESGSAFAVNAFYESDRVRLISDASIEATSLTTASGKPQRAHRCPACKIVLYSLYSDNGDYIRVVKVGTLEKPGELPADVHIYTTTKQPWVKLEDKPIFPENYKNAKVWPEDSMKRLSKVIDKMKADRKAKQTAQASTTGKAKL